MLMVDCICWVTSSLFVLRLFCLGVLVVCGFIWLLRWFDCFVF